MFREMGLMSSTSARLSTLLLDDATRAILLEGAMRTRQRCPEVGAMLVAFATGIPLPVGNSESTKTTTLPGEGKAAVKAAVQAPVQAPVDTRVKAPMDAPVDAPVQTSETMKSPPKKRPITTKRNLMKAAERLKPH